MTESFMQPFTKHTGLIALLDRGNIDTDQIIPKEFLKSIERTGFGDQLFAYWKYKEDGSVDPHFELNNPVYKGSTILVAGNNFGCGSSREHAVWAIVQAGYKAVIAPSKKTDQGMIPGFADIFKNNSGKNGLLLIELSEEEVKEIGNTIRKNPGLKATIDLENQKVILGSGEQGTYPFKIDAGLKNRLIKGLDDIGVTEQYLNQITTFEKTHSAQMV